MSNSQVRVLVVEDDEISMLAARTVLARLGCQVDAAANGVEAIELFAEATYDLILMDWLMPLMNGVEATVRIRQMPQGKVTPIVGTTRMGRAECLAAGMNDVIPKPFVRESMRLALSKWTHWEDALHAESDS